MKKLLFTSLIFVLGLSAAHAGRRYVGFGTPATGENLHAVLDAANGYKDTIYVAAGIYNSGNRAFLVYPGVVLIGGYAKNDSATLTRRYPGQFMFLPTSSSDLSNTTEFTVLDGNSLKTKATDKHRVLEVMSSATDTGVVDGCLIRNGHVRNGNHGGGVRLFGGKLYNSIVRGNVAMADHPDQLSYDPVSKKKRGTFGGGVYITDNGEMVNCLVAYNMANDGYGVVIGPGGGKTINNTVTANTYAPSFAALGGTGYQMYEGKSASGSWADYRGTNAADATAAVPKWSTAGITFTSGFYLSRTLTTESQYAVFCAAIDIAIKGDSGQFSVDTLKKIAVKTVFSPSGATVGDNYAFGTATGMQSFLTSTVIEKEPGLAYKNGIWHPHADTLSMEYPMGNVSWYGALAYSVWLGGGLPTEARWEFAARRNLTPMGIDPETNENLYSGAYGSTVSYGITTQNLDTVTWRILDSIAWIDKTVSIDTGTNKLGFTSPWGDRVHEVARKRPNEVGLYDMTGLMAEWCADAFSTTTYPYGSGNVDDPKPAADDNNYRTVRGGSWFSKNRYEFALSYRKSYVPTTRNGTIGFRPFIDL